MFCKKNELITLGLLNSNVGNYLLNILNPTINFCVNDITAIPIISGIDENREIPTIVKNQMGISKTDWDSFETSWDFKKHPMI